MKLRSSPSLKEPVKRRNPLLLYMTPKLATQLVAMAFWIVGISVWLVSYNPPTKAQAVSEPAPAVAVTTEIKAVDETLLLAMGIDAVVSSVPGGELATDLTMEMVATVIVNRVDDSRYPATIEGVLTQPMQFSCFESTGVKWVGRATESEEFKGRCMAAASNVLSGERTLEHDVVYVSSVAQGTTVAMLDGLYFGR